MKPTAERYQAATKVNALSPEIDYIEKERKRGQTTKLSFRMCTARCKNLVFVRRTNIITHFVRLYY